MVLSGQSNEVLSGLLIVDDREKGGEDKLTVPL